MKNQNKKGFTLVELVIVIAVIAILAGVMIGTFSSVVTSAKQSADYQEIKSRMDEKYYVYIADNKGNTPNCFVISFSSSSNNAEVSGDEDISESMVDFGDMPEFTAPDTETKDSTIATSNVTYFAVKTDESSGTSLDEATGTKPTSGTYYAVTYKDYTAKDTSKNTAASWTIVSVDKVVYSDSKVTSSIARYITEATLVGKKGTEVKLSIEESESESGNYYYSAESVKEK